MDNKAPTFRMTVNKAKEEVQLLGTFLYHRNPVSKGICLATEYVMPKVSVGDVVLWFPGGERDGESTPGIVTNVGQLAIAINITPHGGMSMVPKDAVRHLDDPSLKRTMEIREQGGWDYAPSTKLLYKLASDMEDVFSMLKAKAK